MPSRFVRGRIVLAAWILGTVLTLLQAAAVLAGGPGTDFPK